MKKAMVIGIVIFLVGLFSAYAAEYNYPAIFIENGNLNAVVVVGNKAPSSDVIAQNTILLDLANKAGKPSKGRAKLSSEITTLSQNMILVGSACNNPITKMVLENPSPCNKGIGPGNPMIKLFKVNGYYHLVVAGYTDKETRDAASSLSGYGSLELSGSKIIDDIVQEDAAIEVGDEKETMLWEIDEKIEVNSGNETKSNDYSANEINHQSDKLGIQNETKTNSNDKKIKNNLLVKIVGWIKSLFT
jgi:hypothetical protein